jgi:ABC-type multidrug transport system, permease component
MKAMLALTVLLFRNWLRSKVALFFGILFPIMLFLVFGSVFGSPQPPSYNIYVRNLDVDSDGHPYPLSEALVKILNSTVFEVKLLEAGETPRQSGFTPTRILTIPYGFTDNLLKNAIAVRLNVTADTIVRMVEVAGEGIPSADRERAMRGVEELKKVEQALNVSPVVVMLEGGLDDRLLQPIEVIIRNILAEFEHSLLNASSIIELDTRISNTRQLRAVDYYLPGYIAAFVMTNGLIGVSSVVSDFRRRGVVKFLATTSISKQAWILSLMVVQTVAAVVLTGVMIAVGWLVFSIRALPDPLSFLIILMGVAAFTSLGILLGSVLKEADAVSAASNLLAFPQMFISGAFWPIELMPTYMQQLAQYTPLYHFHNALRYALVLSSPEQAVASIMIVIGITVAATLLAILGTRWRDF